MVLLNNYFAQVAAVKRNFLGFTQRFRKSSSCAARKRFPEDGFLARKKTARPVFDGAGRGANHRSTIGVRYGQPFDKSLLVV
jgi:hypothetical protein